MGKPANTETMEDLDRLIASRYPTMPTHGNQKAHRNDIRRALAGGKQLTAREIALSIGRTPRAVQLAVCNPGWGWLGREKRGSQGYVYFLTGAK